MEKQYISTQKYVKVSPRKARVVLAAIKKLTPAKAIEVLPYVVQKSADPIMNTIKTAMANARMQGAEIETLVFKEIQISEGPRLKRGIAVSRGQYHPIKKRMSHIRVVLTTRKVEEKKLETKKDPTSPKATRGKEGVKKNGTKS